MTRPQGCRRSPWPACRLPAAAVFCLTVILFAVCGMGVAQGHFQLSTKIRVIHVEHLDDGLRVYLRLPMPFLVAQLTGPALGDGTVEPAPYTRNFLERGELLHTIDLQALQRNPDGLGRLLAQGHHLVVEGRRLTAEVEGVRVMPGIEQSPFANLTEAKASFAGPLYPEGWEPQFVGELVVDAQLRYRSRGAVHRYAFSSDLDPGLDGQDEMANVLLDYLPGRDPLVLRHRGLLRAPIEVSRSALLAALSFLLEGVRHILEGLDHVLFVLCLVIGAKGLGDLLWRVTGFTAGHSVTLIAGFFGVVPAGAWFVPAVETGIALSIIYAGAIAVFGRATAATVVVTTAIGLLHGFGFSFVLHDVLRIDAPNLWQSLLSFNLGVELGQLAIVALVYPAILLLERASGRAAAASRWAVALGCILVAAVWTGERVLLVLDAI